MIRLHRVAFVAFAVLLIGACANGADRNGGPGVSGSSSDTTESPDDEPRSSGRRALEVAQATGSPYALWFWGAH